MSTYVSVDLDYWLNYETQNSDPQSATHQQIIGDCDSARARSIHRRWRRRLHSNQIDGDRERESAFPRTALRRNYKHERIRA